ncbi:major facilitator superfamily MFS_1 [Candidatus Rhodobacter oscarellae]|uniref:Major facilitator superfamily MFS_1 n=1 Tax=Candidatus Rhodobacter oscarellae TaxID=1675527 RepID=A0A0J9E7E9_9RHOB|nr:MFS transporter [Candidatus Rhodobacter lobularis]KMW58616.1 major facilitator superfamily MFS_1 [Candidatus Rhodobacter lobularis]
MLLTRNRNFRLFFSAAGVSNLGDGISALAFPWLATLITRDPVLIGAVAAAQRLPWLLFSLPAGVVTDRVDRRKLIIWADALRMFLTLAVVGLVLTAPDLPMADTDAGAARLIAGLCALAFLLGVAEVFRDNTAQTALPQLVDKKDLETANGQLWSIEQIMGQFIGPPVAGFLIAVSVPLPFLIDAATFGVAACLIWAVTLRQVVLAPPEGGFWQQFAQGARWMRAHRTILTFAIMLSVLNFVTFGNMAVLVLFSQEVLGLQATGHGLLLTVSAAGAVAGGLLGPRVARALGSRPTILAALAMFVTAFLAVALAPNAIMAALALAWMWFWGMVWNIVTVSLRQRVIPPALLGRVNAIYRFFGWGSIPLGALSAGLLVAWAEPSLGREVALRLPYLVGAVVAVALLVFAVLRLRIEE